MDPKNLEIRQVEQKDQEEISEQAKADSIETRQDHGDKL